MWVMSAIWLVLMACAWYDKGAEHPVTLASAIIANVWVIGASVHSKINKGE